MNLPFPVLILYTFLMNSILKLKNDLKLSNIEELFSKFRYFHCTFQRITFRYNLRVYTDVVILTVRYIH